ncbi:exostosin-2 [Octopus bimaculoides]|uniref:Exostosin-2 n=1 Tax=Octopus bimaculoides TaxID=37653 RepID=A0A0L8HV23_OCTBM|nr:exostosin-2 [Octopus bimaculoides]|eukprot:XP_014769129.1 PREDICTED: exostosin-2-like [Octopus bimaculoides]
MVGRTRVVRTFYKNNYQFFILILLFVLLLSAILFWPNSNKPSEVYHFNFQTAEKSREVKILSTSSQPLPHNQDCIFHTCMDVYHCGYNDDTKISVYIYPFEKFVDEKGIGISQPISPEFMEIVQTIANSPFYTLSPESACIFVPSIDMLNQNTFRSEEMGQALATLHSWNNGTNHLLFNMLPGGMMEYSTILSVKTDKAIIAGGGFSTWTYRETYDVSIPVFNPLVAKVKLPNLPITETRRWLLISAQAGLHREYREELNHLARGDGRLLLLDRCQSDEKPSNFSQRCRESVVYKYPEVLQNATFCLVIRRARLGQSAFSDALKAGCIPVTVADGYVLPFSEVLDWKRAAVVIREDELGQVLNIVKAFSMERIYEMRRQVQFYWDRYFKSLKDITLTTLQIINDRVFPYAARPYEDWNEPPSLGVRRQVFLPMITPQSPGFTAVILTYDRLDSLFNVIQQVARVPSLAKVFVVWNNQNKEPPQNWPKIGKPLKVVKTRENKLGNRFFPYSEIKTDCILALDDDIIMLTADELEFGYQVWREFSDRLVGFPSRVHLLDNVTQKWKYESEWTNSISMVLTGAAFYHKFYNFLYTYSMPGNIKTWVDEHMNCEDIAFNFLITNTTGKAPIKVTPRKKFKCPKCVNTSFLSLDLNHMVERTECINRFVDIYGTVALRTVEFRADPVLYKDNFPPMLKKFNDIGSL